MNKDNKYTKYVIWHGVVTPIRCIDHVYTYSGSFPCTGELRCMYCGKPKE